MNLNLGNNRLWCWAWALMRKSLVSSALHKSNFTIKNDNKQLLFYMIDMYLNKTIHNVMTSIFYPRTPSSTTMSFESLFADIVRFNRVTRVLLSNNSMNSWAGSLVHKHKILTVLFYQQISKNMFMNWSFTSTKKRDILARNRNLTGALLDRLEYLLLWNHGSYDHTEPKLLCLGQEGHEYKIILVWLQRFVHYFGEQ